MRDVDLNKVVGKRIKRNVFSPEGVLLISLASLITPVHVGLLKSHGITLTGVDVEAEDTYTATGSRFLPIKQAVHEIMRIFKEIRGVQKIPLADLRKSIIPAIHKAVHQEDFLSLFTMLQAKDDYTYRHNIAVGVFATLLGTWLGLEKQELLQLTTAAVLHDVGKMMIPEEILHKPGKLSVEEFEIMKKHTIYGYELLQKTTGISHRQALVALQHHERMDGSGYPFGITGDKIDLFSRIVSVVDVFHAMTSKRVYRDPSPFYEILVTMEKDTYGVLDTRITKLFIEKMINTLSGHSVLLTDGRVGKIVMINPHEPTRPLVQVGEKFIDLRKDPSLRLEKILN